MEDIFAPLIQGLLADQHSPQAIQKLASAVKTQHLSWVVYLLKQKLVDSATLALALADTFGLPLVDLSTVDEAQLPLHLVDKKWLYQYQLLPLWQQAHTLVLGMVDPCDQQALATIKFHTGLEIEIVIVEQTKLIALLERHSVTPQLSARELQEIDNAEQAGQRPTQASSSNTEVKSDDDPPIVRYVNQILLAAIYKRASDVHFEPHAEQLQIRFRIDGILYKMAPPPSNIHHRIITRLKIMAQLDIAEQRIPQDGRFQIAIAEKQAIDCRLSTCPSLHGEKIVVRILDSNKMSLDIDKLGLTPKQKNSFLTALHNPHGMILVTGPTGSGKTLTLYSALHFLNTPSVNISSVEDPVEIYLPGITQVNVQPKIGLNFATVLRAFLRQDPDIIMLGEMRDQETAEIGIKAAQTGHLLLSTLHTNSAAETLTRLANMGIPNYNIATSVHLIIAQRLARCLCPHCKKTMVLPKKTLLQLGFPLQDLENLQLYTTQSCERCTQGYQGRRGIFELLTITPRIAELILQGHSAPAIARQAQQEGMQTLWQSALTRAKQGEISVTEMRRIIKD